MVKSKNIKTSLFNNIKRIKEDINNYEYVCQIIVAIIHTIEYNINAKCCQGKIMLTSNTNKISPNTEITPDVVVEEIRENGYNLIIEIKADLPRDKEHWKDVSDQLMKYDDCLTGWESKNQRLHDIMLITNPNRTFDFNEHLNSNNIRYDRNFSLIDCNPIYQAKEFIMFKKFYGKISDSKLDNKLSRADSIPRLRIINKISQMKFYDSEPPIIYTMMIIWDHIVKKNFEPQNMNFKNNRIIEVSMSVGKTKEDLSRFTPVTNPNCIETVWIRKAFKGFEEIGLATKLDVDGNNFKIKYTKVKGSLLEWFLKLIKESKVKQNQQSNIQPTIDQYLE